MKISKDRLKDIVTEEVRKVISEFDVSSLSSAQAPRSSYNRKVGDSNLREGEDGLLEPVSSFLADWGRAQENFDSWGVAHVGDKIEVNAEISKFGGKVKAVIEPMGGVSGVYHIKSNKNSFARELLKVVESNISDENLPYIKISN